MRRCVSLLIALLAGSLAAACAVPRPVGETASLAPRVSAQNEPTTADVGAASPAAEAAIIPLSPPIRLSRKDRTCLVAAMYYEAHGEGDDGMTAVGHVVLNRLRARPSGTTVCDVVYERGQFGWTHRISRKRVAIGRTQSWKAVAALADRLTAGGEDLTGGATSFYSVLEFTKGPPSWAEAQRETTRIGNHVFVTQ